MFGRRILSTKNCILVISIFLNDAVNTLVKIHNTFQIRGEKTQRQQDSLKTKYSYEMGRAALFRIIF